MGRVKRVLVRSGIGLAVAAPVVGTLGLFWYRGAYSLPPDERPAVRLPSPNAYDTLQAARKLEVAKFGAAEVSPRDPKRPQPPADRKALLSANAAAIAKVREALGQEFLNPPVTTPGMDFPSLAHFRELARLLAFAARTHADAGELPEASRCALDGIEIGIVAPRGGYLIHGLVGIACEAIGQSSLWKLADRLDAKSARAAVQRLAEMEPRRQTFAQTVVQEREYMLFSTRMLFAAGPGKATWEALGDSLNPGFGSDDEDTPPSLKERAEGFWSQARMIYYGPRTVQRNVDTWLAAVAERSTDPWNAHRPLPPLPDDPLSQTMLPVFAQAEFKWVHTQAYSALLETYLALRAWRLERGAYPESLEQLTHGGYVKTLPVDAFSPTRAPLRYRRNADKTMTLWSVGPDAKDDGGRAAEVKNGDGTVRRGYVKSETVGDIVARTNTW